MKTILAVALPALALAACATTAPPPGPVFPSGVDYRAVGTEPFWSLDIGSDMTFIDRGTSMTVVQPTPRPINGVAGEIYQTPRINANIVHAPCTDGMSDRSYPDQVQLTVDGRSYRGCGAPVGWAGWQGEGRAPAGNPSAVTLSGSNWHVAAINGRPTPARDFYMNFAPDGRVSAKLGCNSLGAGYSQSGSALTIGAIMATRMACQDMTFENEGSAILGRPLSISGDGRQLMLTSSAGSIALSRI